MFADIRVRSIDGVISERGEGEVVIKSDFLLKEYLGTVLKPPGTLFRTAGFAPAMLV